MKKEGIFVLAILIILACGAEGCPQTSTGAGGGTSVSGKIDFSLLPSIDALTAGKSIEQGQEFYVQVQVSNSMQEIETGQICIKDNVGGSYLGIPDASDCKQFSISNGNTELIFGPYAYSNIPVSSFPATFFVSMDYRQKSRIESSVSVPLPEIENLNIQQAQEPILVSINKSVRKSGEGYKTDLGIALRENSPGDATMRIFSPDFSKENITSIGFNMGQQTLDCVSGTEKITTQVQIDREKFIRCSTISYLGTEEQRISPFVLTLDYGVRIERQYQFTITKP